MLETALKEYGVKELNGSKHNKRILQYSSDLGLTWVKTDETSWCSIWLSWVALTSGYSYPISSPATARSWLKVGLEVKKPKIGDIAIFWRESKDSWKGHVGIYISESNAYVYVLGGNQNNMVCIKAYPKSKLLGYRRI